MYSGNLISLKTILWQVYQHPLTDDLNYEDAAEYAIDGIRLIGAPLSYIDKVTFPPLEVVNYKAALPDDMVTLRGVKLLNGSGESFALTRATDIYHASIPCNDSGPSISNDDNTFPSNPYDESNQGVNADIVSDSCGDDGMRMKELTYTAQNGVIQTSFKDGEIEVSYQAIACDKEGYPLIPDNVQVRECLRYYILFRFLEPLWVAGKVTDKAFQYIDQKKCFYMGSANTSMQLQGIDHLESVMNAVNRLIVNDQAFNNFYKGAGLRERIKRYN